MTLMAALITFFHDAGPNTTCPAVHKYFAGQTPPAGDLFRVDAVGLGQFGRSAELGDVLGELHGVVAVVALCEGFKAVDCGGEFVLAEAEEDVAHAFFSGVFRVDFLRGGEEHLPDFEFAVPQFVDQLEQLRWVGRLLGSEG